MVDIAQGVADRPPQMREQILDAATRCFATRGFDGTSLQEIAESVGIRKPSLLYHFPSKDILRLRVLENVMSHWNDVMPRLLLAATSSHGQFDGVLNEMVSFFTADPDRARLLLREVLDRPLEIRELMQKHVRPWVKATADFIRKGQAKKRLWDDVDPEAYVALVINLIISNVATYEALGTTDFARSTQESLRVAKSSLFRPKE
jgi:TetR/AcrR family transcriptional regulator